MEAIKKYFPNITNTQLEKFNQFQDLMKDWNSKINLVSRKDIDNFLINHLLHSLSIAKYIDFKKNSNILDVGTGGGLPGIPLAIAFPDVEFHLIDSIRKKINVVNDIIYKLKLNNVKATWVRAETVDEKFDFIVSRAVTNIPQLYQWTSSKIKKLNKNSKSNGLLLLKGGDLDNELESIKSFVITDLTDFFEEDYFCTKKLIHIIC